MSEPGSVGSKAPVTAWMLMKCAPVNGENWPACSMPAFLASATVAYLRAATRASTSCLASSARVVALSGWSGRLISLASSMLHDPGAAPGTHFGAVVVVGCAVTVRTVVDFDPAAA